MTKCENFLCAGLLIAASAAPALAGAPFKTSAAPGTRPYRYTVVEHVQGKVETQYRVDFDLVTDAAGGVTAVIRKAAAAKGEAWTTPSVADDCKTALHGNGAELARITLAPITPEAAASLGEPFMAMCAPAAYFFPMTDILNVVLIQTSPQFRLSELTAPGASARFEGFDTKLDRLGMAMTAASPGGQIKLGALDEHTATIDWLPDPMQLTLIHHASAGQPEMTLSGVERFAFRVEIDRASGELRRAATTFDNLDLAVSMPGLPSDKAPHIAISREVAIAPRD